MDALDFRVEIQAAMLGYHKSRSAKEKLLPSCFDCGVHILLACMSFAVLFAYYL